jgi:hypothetical protein
MQTDDEMESRLDSLIEAIENEDRQAVLGWIRGEQFTLVSLSDEEDALSAMILETEEFPALVAFLSTEQAEEFVDSIADQIEGDEVDLFEVAGEDLLTPLAKEFGLLINPESDDAIMISPDLLHDASDEDVEE